MASLSLPIRGICLFLVLESSLAKTDITFLHWNDQHARVEPADDSGATCYQLVKHGDASKCFGGYARLATFFAQVRSRCSGLFLPCSVLLDHGLLG